VQDPGQHRPRQGRRGDQSGRAENGRQRRKGGGAQTEAEHHGDNAVGADAAVAHDAQLVVPRPAAAKAVRDVAKAILVKGSGQDDENGQRDEGGCERRQADPVGENERGARERADTSAHQRKHRQRAGQKAIAPGRSVPRPLHRCSGRAGQKGEEPRSGAQIAPPARCGTARGFPSRADFRPIPLIRGWPPAWAVGWAVLHQHAPFLPLEPIFCVIGERCIRKNRCKPGSPGNPLMKYKPPATSLVTSLADVRRLLHGLPGPDQDAAARCAAREPELTKPPGALGRLEALSAWLCAWQGRHPPRLSRPAARVFAANHGVAARGVSAFPADVTAQMVANFHAGGAAVNQLCQAFGVGLAVEAITLENPTADFTTEPAMSEAGFVDAFNRGLTAVGEDIDVLALGEMGIGNTTAAAAIAHALFGGAASDWTGPGTGVEGAALRRKTEVVEAAVALHGPAAGDPLDLLRRLGGRELVAIAGAIIGARLARIPVLLDGFICTAAAACLAAAQPDALDHCQAAHVSAEPGHRALLRRLDKEPLLDLGMRLGEASGAVLAVAVLRAAVACHTGMATFGEAGVSDK
jgi:nicotinate-nucleotide--dimethylbenzimidazole phosphoribosyltransferase